MQVPLCPFLLQIFGNGTYYEFHTITSTSSNSVHNLSHKKDVEMK